MSESCGCQMLFVHQASYPTETYDSFITLSALRGGENCLPLSSSFLKNLSLWTLRLFRVFVVSTRPVVQMGKRWEHIILAQASVVPALWLWLFLVINPAAINNQWSDRCRRFKVTVGPNLKPICCSSICGRWHRRVEVYGNKVLH